MIIKLDMTSNIPIYVQLRNEIVMGIGRGDLKKGEGLPTVRQMAEDIGVNNMTVNKAYSILKNEGYMVILISASPEFYIKEFYAIDEVDLIIGTRFKFENGKFIRSMDGNNCKGQEKVRRLKAVLKEKNIEADFKNSYMFSDSLSDKPLLDLVGNPYLINYKKKHEIEILKWK